MGLIEIPGNRNHGLPRIVVGLNIVQQILTSEPPDRLLPTQDRAAERMASQYLARVKLLHEIFRIVPDHTNFFQDDLFFFFDFFVRETGMVKQVCEEIQRSLKLLIQHLHVIGCRFTRREGIHLSTKCIDFARNFGGGALARSLEEHVFDEVGIACLGWLFVP